MCLQAELNNQAIEMMPIILSVIQNSNEDVAGKIKHYALNRMRDSIIAYTDMTEDQKIAFQNNILDGLRYREII